jgi:hypothetical protein
MGKYLWIFIELFKEFYFHSSSFTEIKLTGQMFSVDFIGKNRIGFEILNNLEVLGQHKNHTKFNTYANDKRKFIVILFTAMSQLWLYEYMFQMWRIDPYTLCIRTFNHI